MNALPTNKTPLRGAARRHVCEGCGHVAQVEAIFGPPQRPNAPTYYFWPTPLCVYCRTEMRNDSNGSR